VRKSRRGPHWTRTTLATFIREVVDGSLSDTSFDDAQQRLGTRGVVEYIYCITMILTV
jgi:hypothetical protein